MPKKTFPAIKGHQFQAQALKTKDGKRIALFYSLGSRFRVITNADGSKGRESYNAIIAYAKDYTRFPADLSPENDTDTMTDYHEKDRLVFPEGSSEYILLLPFVQAYKADEAAKNIARAKRMAA